MRVLITGGAGFVGSSLALLLHQEHPDATIIVVDNLKRRGSELAIPRLQAKGIQFVHADVRISADLRSVGPVDVILDCAAEPSAHTGYGDSPMYAVQSNLIGTINTLEVARQHGAKMIFLSSSRVYPFQAVRTIPLQVQGDRLTPVVGAEGPGWSHRGITEDFPLHGSRTLYGATKLASELLIEEYREMYGLDIFVNRCGALAGAWQMGKVDQGFMVLWAAHHYYAQPLSYMGFGGHGHQVRDVLHVSDLYALLSLQLAGRCPQRTYNVGGGLANSLSLVEATVHCQKRSGRAMPIDCQATTREGDIPWYVTDFSRLQEDTGWQPRTNLDDIFDEIFDWLHENEVLLTPFLGGQR